MDIHLSDSSTERRTAMKKAFMFTMVLLAALGWSLAIGSTAQARPPWGGNGNGSVILGPLGISAGPAGVYMGPSSLMYNYNDPNYYNRGYYNGGYYNSWYRYNDGYYYNNGPRGWYSYDPNSGRYWYYTNGSWYDWR
jgi:hypothetical protein